MKKNNYTVIYLVLTLLLISSAGVLGMQVKHYKYNREVKPTEELRIQRVDKEELAETIRVDKADVKRNSNLVFARTKIFQALATPMPTATKVPRAKATPTPATPGKKWTVDLVTRKIAIIYDYANSFYNVKVGDVLKDSAWGDFKVLEFIQPTYIGNDRGKVKIQHIKSGTVSEISAPYVKKKKKTVPKKIVPKKR